MDLTLKMLTMNTLRDIHFSISYWLYTHAITKAEANAAIKRRLEDVITSAKKENKLETTDPELLELYSGIKTSAANGQATTKPIFNIMEDFIKNVERAKVFRAHVNPDYNATNVWIYSNMPEYFLKHPIKGLETKVVRSFDEVDYDSQSLYLSVPEFVANCTMAGHIKAPIEFRFTAPRYDTKKKSEIQRFLYSIAVHVGEFKKVSLKNNIQEWSFTVIPNGDDIFAMNASVEAREKLIDIVEGDSTGKTYLICLEDEPITPKGFKTQADVQKFLDSFEEDIVSLSAEKNPTSIYLDTTTHLMSIKNAKGDTLPLTKFRFNLKKAK